MQVRRLNFTEKQIDRMVYLREEESMGLRDIAKLMGCTKETVARYLRTRNNPAAPTTDAAGVTASPEPGKINHKATE